MGGGDILKFVTACRKFFGMKSGETLTEFMAEVKALTPEDRKELAELLSVELNEEVEL